MCGFAVESCRSACRFFTLIFYFIITSSDFWWRYCKHLPKKLFTILKISNAFCRFWYPKRIRLQRIWWTDSKLIKFLWTLLHKSQLYSMKLLDWIYVGFDNRTYKKLFGIPVLPDRWSVFVLYHLIRPKNCSVNICVTIIYLSEKTTTHTHWMSKFMKMRNKKNRSCICVKKMEKHRKNIHSTLQEFLRPDFWNANGKCCISQACNDYFSLFFFKHLKK